MFKTVIFDCDGTVLETLPLIVHSFSSVSERFLGHPMTMQQVLERFGPTETQMVLDMVNDPSKQGEAVELFYQVYETNHADFIRPNPGIFELIRELREAGCQIGMVTGKGRRSLDIDLERVGLRDDFSILVTGDDVSEPKPSPEGILKAMAQLRATPSSTLYVGDSNADIAAARAASITALAAQWLSHPQTSTYTTAPDFTIQSPADLRQIVLS